MVGTIKAWVGPRKFGFITVPDHPDVFLHASALRGNLAALRRLLRLTPSSAVPARRALSDATVSRGSYLF